jgi:hypothetical protein
MTQIINQIFPKTISNSYLGPKIPLYVFYFITLITVARSLTHIFAPDGGASSIATIPIDNFINGGKETVIFLFAVWGLSQLMIGLLYLIVSLRYKSLVALMYVSIFVEYLGRWLIGHTKTIQTLGTAPGEIGNYVMIPLSLVMLGWIIIHNYKTS